MRIAVLATAACLSIVGLSAASDVQAAIRRPTSIPAQGLAPALQILARDRDFQVVYRSEVVGELRTQGASGDLTADEALRQLLSGTGLTFRYLDDKTVTITPIASSAPTATDAQEAPTAPQAFNNGETTAPGTAKKAGFWDRLRLAQNEPSSQSDSASSREENPSQSSNKSSEGRVIEEVIVTGTSIRGASPAGSQLITIDRSDIDRTGAATIQDVLKLLPQNFGGGHSDDTTNEPGLGGLNNFDPSYGTAVNLRGLGSGSTLVVVNGRRSATSGKAEFVDISMIPLSAVDRIEVLADGASAIYGSDAVGGVVNIILRQDFQGADTLLHFGGSTHGDADDWQLAQGLGTRWSSGSVLFGYEYRRRDDVNAMDRDFSANASGPYDLVPGQESHSGYVSFRQALTEGLDFFGDALYADRAAEYQSYDQFTPEFNWADSDVQQFGGSLGVAIGLPGAWRLELVGVSSQNETELILTSPSQFSGLGELFNQSKSQLWSVDANLTGDLFQLPGGTSKLALGASFRDESYRFADRFSVAPEVTSDVRAVYAEVFVPIVGTQNATRGMRALELSLAGRYDEYKDFGGTFNPKLGISWSPSDNVTLRGTYGTSFKAPTLFQRNEFANVNALATGPDSQAPDGTTRAVFRIGNNDELREETADTWTVGLNFRSPSASGFTAELTYFDVRFDGRIATPPFPSFEARFNDPIYAELRIRRGEIPDQAFDALVTELLSGSTRVSSCAVPIDPATGACSEPVTNFDAIVELRTVNVAQTHTTGMDAILQQRFQTNIGAFDLDLNANYVFDLEQRVTQNAPTDQLVDTAGNPVDLRLRGSAAWNRNGWGIYAALNYSDDYTDNIGAVDAKIASWTTLDIQASYDAEHRFGSTWFDGLVLSATVLNVLDKDPPFFAGQSVGLGYDPTNADPLGRVINLRIAKRW